MRGSWDELSEIKMLTSLSKLIMEKDPSEVLQLIDASMRKDPGLVLMKATALSNLNRTPEAISLLEKETDSNPRAKYEPDIASKLSILYRQVGNDQKTVEFLAPIIEEGYFKDHLLIKQILADAYIRTRKADKALPLLDGEQDWRSKEMIERARHALGEINIIPKDGKPAEDGIAAYTSGERKAKQVWVIHGRNEELNRDIFSFLRAIGLDPIEWSEARAKTGVSSPYIGKILEAGFDYAQAFVVLLTGDDEAKLRDQYIKQNDPEYERNLTSQARQNVIFEAGMAFGRNPDEVIFVQQGNLRPFSNISGIHILELNNTAKARLEFASRLKSAGCDVPDLMTRHDWLKVGNFESNVSEQSRSTPTILAEATKPIENSPEVQENPTLPIDAQTLLKKEMDDLINPIFIKLPDKDYFTCRPARPYGDYPDGGDPLLPQKTFEFWTAINGNLWLAPKSTQDKMKPFVDLKLGKISKLSNEECKEIFAKFKDSVNERREELIRAALEIRKVNANNGSLAVGGNIVGSTLNLVVSPAARSEPKTDDQLARKYERLNREIKELLEPLISKKDDYLVFESAGDYGSNSPYGKEHKIFWENIKGKMYLADKALYSELQNYLSAMEKYKKSGYVDAYMGRSDEAKDEFRAEKDKLIRQIELSFENLKEEMRETEMKLKIR